MSTKEIASIYGQISELFAKLSTAVCAAETDAESVEHVEDDKKSVKSDVKSEKKSSTGKAGVKTEEELQSMQFNALKKYAVSLGVDPAGKRNDIIARILGASDGAEAEEAVPVEDKKPGKKDKDNVVPIEKKREENSEYEETADSLMKEYDVEDLIAELEEAGVKGVTKRTLRKKLIEALKKGLINLEEEDDEDDSEDDADGDEVDENTYFEDYDDEDRANDPNNVTEKSRLDAMVEVQKDILNDIDREKLDVEEMKSFLLENSTEDEQQDIEGYDDDDVIAAYCEIRKRYIDDDGDDYSDSDDPYYVNGNVYAHAHKCAVTDGEYIDEVSGEKFELDEE